MSTRPRSVWGRLYHGETAFDFVGRKPIWFLLSSIIILIGVVSLIVRGLNFGIDFRGGTSWEVRAPHVTVADARSAVSSLGVPGVSVQQVGKDTIRVEGDVKGQGGAANRAIETEVAQKLATLAHTSTSQVSVSDVGPSWGSDISNKAWRALGFFLLAIIIYLSLRFEPKMAAAAIIAVLHDILITVGIYAIFGF